jgi:hypothetical protein
MKNIIKILAFLALANCTSADDPGLPPPPSAELSSSSNAGNAITQPWCVYPPSASNPAGRCSPNSLDECPSGSIPAMNCPYNSSSSTGTENNSSSSNISSSSYISSSSSTSSSSSSIQNFWNGTANTNWYNATLTEFTITTAEQLAGLAGLVNEGNNFNGKTIKINADIMLNDTANWENWANNAPANKWTALGVDETKPFSGTFDGNGHKISGIYVNSAAPANNSADGRNGFFGFVNTNGTIKNIGVVASYMYVSYTADNVVGGLAGYNQGTISNSYSTATVIGKGPYVGGLVGCNGDVAKVTASRITNSYSTGIVKGEKDNVGGLVGENRGTISFSYSIGAVTGSANVGGLVGRNSIGTVTNSYYDTQTSGQTTSSGGTGKPTADMKLQTTFVNWDFSTIWSISSAINNGYPYLLENKP